MNRPAGYAIAAFMAGALVGAAVSAGIFLRRPCVFLDAAAFDGPTVFEARVKEVVDGDTVKLENGLHLRYAGIDTPEIAAMREVNEPQSYAAKDRNQQLVLNQTIRIELAPEKIDRYGRLVGRVFREDGAAVDATLVSEGLARTLALGQPPPQELEALEAAARTAGKGIWSAKPPPASRKQAAFVASRNSDIYHLPACPKAANIKPDNELLFGSEADAKQSGRRPCPFCLPAAAGEPP